MPFFVVRLAFEKLLERPDRLFRLLPIELKGRELFRRGDELTIGLLPLALDPWSGQVREETTTMCRDRRAQMLDRIARSARIARLAAPSQRTTEDLEVHMDRGG